MKRSVILGTLAAIGLLAVPAVGRADLTCPAGQTNPIYCSQTPPEILSESVLKTTGTAAQVQASINPHGAATAYLVQYGTSLNYSSSTPQGSLPPDSKPDTAPGNISGLKPGTQYHFRYVATNSGGTTYGGDGVFKTKGLGNRRGNDEVTDLFLPTSVRHGQRFLVSFNLTKPADVTIEIKLGKKTIATTKLRNRRSVSIHFKAPAKKGKYTLVIITKTKHAKAKALSSTFTVT